MADEYIRKQDVLNLPQSIERNLRGEIVERSVDVGAIEALPSADVVQVVHGHWIDVGSLSCRCDQCGCKSNKETRFCPNCGHKREE